MNVFGVGPLEIAVILVVALVFVGPERLPRLAADLARTIREIRKYTGSFAAEFNEVIKDFERETQADRGEWTEIGRGLSEATASVRDALQGAQTDAAGPAEPAEAARPAAPVAAEPATNGAGEGEWREIAPRNGARAEAVAPSQPEEPR